MTKQEVYDFVAQLEDDADIFICYTGDIQNRFYATGRPVKPGNLPVSKVMANLEIDESATFPLSQSSTVRSTASRLKRESSGSMGFATHIDKDVVVVTRRR